MTRQATARKLAVQPCPTGVFSGPAPQGILDADAPMSHRPTQLRD